ncbi:ankyrin repeat domain-containing protein [Thermocladium modestius]|uniref:ankyrin repeat domain-containing protein n=1 Tax=Thermocladium modestius TaxID=62609 RepID=UPI00166B795B|nr:ankyrin repeat domain-containing protein [Thermocladium modestius]
MACFNASFRVYLREEIVHDTLGSGVHNTLGGFREVKVGGCFKFLACGGFSCAYAVDYNGSRLTFKVPRDYRNYVEGSYKPSIVAGIDANRKELEILTKLNHPNIVRLLGYGVDLPILVYEYGEHTLRDLMAKGLGGGDCLKYASQLAEALRFIHSRGVVHNDIKPENVLIVNGVAKLTDFNTATMLLATASSSRLSICTAGYCAPEQLFMDLRRGAVEGGFENRIDVYQLGDVLLECLTGETIDGEAVNEAKVNEALSKVNNKELRQPLLGLIIRHMLNYRPEERPSSEEVVKVIKAIKEGEAIAKEKIEKNKETEVKPASVPDYLSERLLNAAAEGDVGRVKELLGLGVDPNVKNNDGYAPLHYAAIRGNLDVVKYLVEHGADVSARDAGGNTPLHDAAMEGKLDVVKYLVEHGANINARNKDGMTPLDAAMKRRRRDVIDYLNRYQNRDWGVPRSLLGLLYGNQAPNYLPLYTALFLGFIVIYIGRGSLEPLSMLSLITINSMAAAFAPSRWSLPLTATVALVLLALGFWAMGEWMITVALLVASYAIYALGGNNISSIVVIYPITIVVLVAEWWLLKYWMVAYLGFFVASMVVIDYALSKALSPVYRGHGKSTYIVNSVISFLLVLAVFHALIYVNALHLSAAVPHI